MLLKRRLAMLASKDDQEHTQLFDNREFDDAQEVKISGYELAQSGMLQIKSDQTEEIHTDQILVHGFYIRVEKSCQITLGSQGSEITVEIPVATQPPFEMAQWCVDGRFESIKLKATGGDQKAVYLVWGNAPVGSP